jgi:hypothetical protein
MRDRVNNRNPHSSKFMCVLYLMMDIYCNFCFPNSIMFASCSSVYSVQKGDIVLRKNITIFVFQKLKFGTIELHYSLTYSQSEAVKQNVYLLLSSVFFLNLVPPAFVVVVAYTSFYITVRLSSIIGKMSEITS